MAHPILVSAAELDERVAGGRALPVDCRFDFADTAKGRT